MELAGTETVWPPRLTDTRLENYQKNRYLPACQRGARENYSNFVDSQYTGGLVSMIHTSD